MTILKRAASEELLSNSNPSSRDMYIDAVSKHFIVPHQNKSHFFSHLATSINRSLFSPAHSFDQPGLYIYKRPVRSGTPQHQALLSTAGTLLHHVVIYIKTPGTSSNLIAMEFGPNDESMADITTDIHATVPPDHSRLLCHDPELPERHCLPMLRVDLPHHHVDADPVIKAIQFAASKKYQVMSNNCIHFACFMIFVLTKGRLRNAPLVFDVVCGKTPINTTTDGTNTVSPSLLDIMMGMMGMNWYDAVDGGRLIREFLEQHPYVFDDGDDDVPLVLLSSPVAVLVGNDDDVPLVLLSSPVAVLVGNDDDVPLVLLSSPVAVLVGNDDEERKEQDKKCDLYVSDKTVERDDKVRRMRMMMLGGTLIAEERMKE